MDSSSDNKLQINHCLSLGYFCWSSLILKQLSLKLCSYPFDWIVSSKKFVLECLEDNFCSFLNRDEYTPWNTNSCGHKRGSKDCFVHRNPLLREEDYQYYKNCVERFRLLTQQSFKKLFVVVYNNFNVNFKETNVSQKGAIVDQLNKMTQNFRILFIEMQRNSDLELSLEFEREGVVDTLVMSKPHVDCSTEETKMVKAEILKHYDFSNLIPLPNHSVEKKRIKY